MAKNKKTNKKQSKNIQKERIPDGMRREDYADAAFKKKVTIIMGSVLLAFIIGIVAILVGGWVKTQKHNEELEAREQRFEADKARVLQELKAIDDKGGTFEDRAQVKITITDENYSEWIAVLDESYSLPEDEDGYAAFKGATVEIEGLFYKNVYDGGNYEYLVYRIHDHTGDAHNHDEESHEGEETTEVSLSDMIPIEVVFADKDASVPADGEWVKVTGVVGPGSIAINYSAIRNAEVTVLEEAGNKYIE